MVTTEPAPQAPRSCTQRHAGIAHLETTQIYMRYAPQARPGAAADSGVRWQDSVT